MLYTGLFKRVIPFVLTFAAGLLLAGIFGAAVIPNLERGTDGRRGRRCHEKRQLLMEIDQLNQELRDARLESETLRQRSFDWTLEEAVPPVPVDPYHPPKRPKKPARPDSLQ